MATFLSLAASDGSRFERRRAATALHPALSTSLARPLRTAEAATNCLDVGGVAQIPAAALEVTPAVLYNKLGGH